MMLKVYNQSIKFVKYFIYGEIGINLSLLL